MKTNQQTGKKMRFVLVVFLPCLLLLGGGILGMQILAGMKSPPIEKLISERPLPVEVLKADMESVTPFITGYGEVGAVNVVTISPEIPGKVVEVHPRLERGELIAEGETLIKIDTSEDDLSLKINKTRLKTLKRNLELVKREYQRLENLYQKNKLASLSDVEKAEQGYNTMIDQVNQLEHSIDSSQLNIKRGTITAPFDGRVKTVSVERGQYVSPGVSVVTLADDSLLEILVSVDSEKAKELLRFKTDSISKSRFWFSRLEQSTVTISWLQGEHSVETGGILHRIVDVDPKTRTLKLAVRLSAENTPDLPAFPIVEGLFCQVKIPGAIIKNVIKLPRQAVQFDNKVRIVVESRLKTIPVDVKWVDSDFAFITAGLKSDDTVIISNLSEPMENSLVETSTHELIATNSRR
ncbi:efflux RND transporter periplasmic adaptor subunit [bacterium]|nr:efflux RND transporter periplasmic adaptor subunit [bacterium]